MIEGNAILGAGQGSPIVVIITVGVFIVLHVLGAIANASKKKQDEQKRKLVREQIAGRSVTLAPEIQLRVPPPIPGMRSPQPKQKRGKPQQPKRNQPLRQSPALSEPAAPLEPVSSRASLEPRAAAQQKPVPARVDAAALNKWLNPVTLRQQFILTELFQPPLALREPRER